MTRKATPARGAGRARHLGVAGVAALAAVMLAEAKTPGARGGPAERWLVPAATQKAWTWRYTLADPGKGFAAADFDDSAWKAGPAGFGTEGTPNAVIGTTWSTKRIWLRTTFEYDGAPFKAAALRVHYDERPVVYLNGRKIWTGGWYITDYETHDVTAEAGKALRKGKNVLAVSCAQTYGGQYIDVGLVLDPKDKPEVPHKLPPLKPLFDFPVRDTSICLAGETYYLTGTTGHPTWWVTNDGIRMWKSKDLRNWTFLGLVWSVEKDGTWQKKFVGKKRAVWAPEVHYVKGTFWLTYSMNYRGCGLLKSASARAEGPYKDVKPDGPLTGNIDASLFQDDDGKVYFVYQNGRIARLNDEMTALAEEPRLLKPAGARHVGFEGAFLFKAGGRYHLACAEFDRKRDYHCMVASSDKLYGPYGRPYLAVPHGGHNMFFRDAAGNWWSTFFGNDSRAPFRERPGILRIRFSPEGRIAPVLGQGGPK